MKAVETAKEFIDNYSKENDLKPNLDIEDMLIKFATKHVEACKVATRWDPEGRVSESYPLTNIK